MKVNFKLPEAVSKQLGGVGAGATTAGKALVPVAVIAGGGVGAYAVAHALSDRGDWEHPVEWGVGTLAAAGVAGGVSLLAHGKGLKSVVGGLERSQAALAKIQTIVDSPKPTMAQIREVVEPAVAKDADTRKVALARAAMTAGLAGVGGTAFGILSTAGRLSKPTIDVNHHVGVEVKEETTLGRMGREAEAGGSFFGDMGNNIANGWNGLWGGGK